LTKVSEMEFGLNLLA